MYEFRKGDETQTKEKTKANYAREQSRLMVLIRRQYAGVRGTTNHGVEPAVHFSNVRCQV
jgi:hypothetical protein